MITALDSSAAFLPDTQGLDALRREARSDPQAALKGAAQQFEAIFLNAMLKSMRAATPQDGILDSRQTREYTSLLDQQLAQTLSRQGTGLSGVLLEQLRAGLPGFEAATPPKPTPSTTMGVAKQNSSLAATGAASDFLRRMMPHALQASRATGIPARFLLGQAALESDWGRHQPCGADGRPSYNVFGIKAGANWHGLSVQAMTTEYVAGVARRVRQRFRAYTSYAAAFADYARLIANAPRYASVAEHSTDAADFASSLQRAGYATDPRYAQKLARIIDGAPMRRALSA